MVVPSRPVSDRIVWMRHGGEPLSDPAPEYLSPRRVTAPGVTDKAGRAERRIGAHKNCGGRGRVGTQINSSVRRGLPADRRDWNSGRIGVRSSWPAPLLSVIMAPMPAVGLVRRVPGLETAVGRGDRRCRQRTAQQRLARFRLTCACPMWRGQRWGPSSLTVPAAMVGARENLACERTGCGPPGQSAREPGHGERGCALRDRRA